MDGVSTALTVWNVLQATKNIIDFLKAVKDANVERLSLIRELETTLRLLDKIHELANRNPSTLDEINSVSGSFEQYRDTVSTIQNKIASAQGIKDVLKRIRFVFGKTGIQELLNTLERHKSNFALYLATQNLEVSLQNNLTLEGIDAKLGAVKLDASQMDELKSFLLLSNSRSWPSPKRAATTMIPFDRDLETFVHRDEYLDRVSQIFDKSHRAAIYGLGGIGKSRIAIEYSYKMREVYPHMSIFWIYAADEPHFHASYKKILQAIPKDFQLSYSASGDTNAAENQDDSLLLVQAWLDSDESGEWLVILDNADEPSMFLTAKAKGTRHYLPSLNRGRLLVTSRSKEVALSTVGLERNLVHVGFLTEEESMKLFRNLLSTDESLDQIIGDLARALDFLPLAIKQAAAYMSQTSISATEYLDMFRNEANQQNLLSEDFGDLSRDFDPDVSNAVVWTWQVSFKQIQSRSASAADLMAFMSVLSREAIHKSLLIQFESNNLQLTRSIGILRSFSLIVPNAGIKDAYTMHRLVQMTVRIWSQKQKQLRLWERKAVEIIHKVFRNALDMRHWGDCQLLYPHARLLCWSTPSDAAASPLREELLESVKAYENPPIDRLASQASTYLYDSIQNKQPVPGSTKWFFDNASFRAWKSAGAGLLLLVGAPGSGKTTLFASLVKYLLARFANHQAVVLHFIVSYRYALHDPAGDLLRHLIFQACSAMDVLPDRVREIAYDDGTYRERENPDQACYLLEVFQEIVSSLQRPVFVLVDALDECSLKGQQEITELLLELARGTSSTPCHCFITSRRGIDMSLLSSQDEVRVIDLQHERDNLMSGVRKLLKNGFESGKLAALPKEKRERIIETTMEKSSTSFTMARLLLQQTSEYQASAALEAIMKQDASLEGLKDVYLRVINHISDPTGVSIIRWALYSFRPLTLKEMAAAVQLNTVSMQHDLSVAGKTTEVSRISCGLVYANANDEDAPVRLLHASLRDFFETYHDELPEAFRFDESESHAVIFKRCIETIFESSALQPDELLQKPPLLSYAAEYWPSHFKRCCKEQVPAPEMLDLLRQLFDQKNPQPFHNWLRTHDPAIQDKSMPTKEKQGNFPNMEFYINLLGLPISPKGEQEQSK
ncbi:MAG: hypothetical protein Q9227_005532 [Pyrenula ochraceoflavens]